MQPTLSTSMNAAQPLAKRSQPTRMQPLGLRLKGACVVFNAAGEAVGTRREVTAENVSYGIHIHPARGHRKGYGPRVATS